METFDIELAINYCTFENFKQKSAQILNNLFAQGRINDYARFHSYGIITPMDEQNRHIHIEEIDKFNRLKTNCIIYDLLPNKYNRYEYDKLFIYYSLVARETSWYGYVLYNSKTGKTNHKYCIKYADDTLYQYIYRSIVNLGNHRDLYKYHSEHIKAVQNHDNNGLKTVKQYNEMITKYKEFFKLPFNINTQEYMQE